MHLLNQFVRNTEIPVQQKEILKISKYHRLQYRFCLLRFMAEYGMRRRYQVANQYDHGQHKYTDVLENCCNANDCPSSHRV